MIFFKNKQSNFFYFFNLNKNRQTLFLYAEQNVKNWRNTHVCVCLYVCERDRKREQKERERDNQNHRVSKESSTALFHTQLLLLYSLWFNKLLTILFLLHTTPQTHNYSCYFIRFTCTYLISQSGSGIRKFVLLPLVVRGQPDSSSTRGCGPLSAVIWPRLVHVLF